MRMLPIFLGAALLTTAAMAADPGNRAPVKAVPIVPVNVPTPVRQGGDTILNATPIPSLPYSTSGSTAGYSNDYDEICPYTGSMSPDVVYSFTPLAAITVAIDLCGSSYDTKLYIYDGGLSLVACNDDFYFDDACGIYVSKLEWVSLQGGQTYYIIVDGYGGDFGSYHLDMSEMTGPWFPCPPDGVHEGEPPLVDDYVDLFNGGCNTSPGHPFQELTGDDAGELSFCGVSGWYQFEGSDYRDTDWFLLTMGPTGTIDVEVGANQAVYLFELGPQDCTSVAVIQSAIAWPGPTLMTITGYAPGEVVWFWIGPTVFYPPDPFGNEFDYVAEFSGLEPIVAREATSWSTIKALYE